MLDELLRYRSQFPILEQTTFLISNSLGAMPRAVYDAMKGYADTWATRGVRAWEERWWMLAAECAQRLGLYPPERDDLPGYRGFMLRFFRKTQPGGLQRHEFPLGDVFLGGATGPRSAG